MSSTTVHEHIYFYKMKRLFALFFFHSLSSSRSLCVCYLHDDDKNQGSIYVFMARKKKERKKATTICVVCCMFQLKSLFVITCVDVHVTRLAHSLSTSASAAAAAATDDDDCFLFIFALLNRCLRSAHFEYLKHTL